MVLNCPPAPTVRVAALAGTAKAAHRIRATAANNKELETNFVRRMSGLITPKTKLEALYYYADMVIKLTRALSANDALL
jgi:hypothetical protein